MASTKISDLTAAAALAATDRIPVVQSVGSGPVRTTPDAIKTYVETGGTVTASDPVLDLTQTWNSGATTFTGLKFNVTDTASAAASLLADLQVGGTTKFNVDKSGAMRAYSAGASGIPVIALNNLAGTAIGFWSGAGAASANLALTSGVATFTDSGANIGFSSGNLAMRSAGDIRWSSGATIFTTTDLYLLRGGAGILQQRNGTNAQTLQVFGTYTDASNYVRGSLAATSTAVTLAAETAGTGADNVPVIINPGGTSQIEVGNGVQFTEMTAPSAPAANKVILFAQDNGAGKTQLMALFPSGAAQQVAIEP